jgi:pyruvyltransferase
MNNFGDLLGPLLVDRIIADLAPADRRRGRRKRLLTVGSIVRLARDGDTVWGSGANGKSIDSEHRAIDIDVRAVRGPLTREFLERRGISTPCIFGDPGLLLGSFWTREQLAAGHAHRRVVVVPNLHDKAVHAATPGFVDPQAPVFEVLGAIAASDFVVGSSLHAIVVADSLGIPARLLTSATEPAFKYQDYYLGSGRSGFTAAASVAEALRLGGEAGPRWTPDALLESFPFDLWGQTTPDASSDPARRCDDVRGAGARTDGS